MNFDNIKIRQLLAGLGACMAVLVVAAPANARPDSSVGAGVAPQQQRLVASTDPATIRVIPYLSHGMLKPAQTIKVIPYLSQGLLTAADVKAAAGTRATDNSDVVSRYLRSHETRESRTASWYLGADQQPQVFAQPSVTSQGDGPLLRDKPDGFQPQPQSLGDDVGTSLDSGRDWETTGFVAGSLAAALLAVAMMIALRHRRGGLRSA